MQIAHSFFKSYPLQRIEIAQVEITRQECDRRRKCYPVESAFQFRTKATIAGVQMSGYARRPTYTSSLLIGRSSVASAAPYISSGSMSGPHYICSQDLKRGLWIYQNGFHKDQFIGYYVDGTFSSGAFNCTLVNSSTVLWECLATTPQQRGASATVGYSESGNWVMSFFKQDRVENPVPADRIVCR